MLTTASPADLKAKGLGWLAHPSLTRKELLGSIAWPCSQVMRLFWLPMHEVKLCSWETRVGRSNKKFIVTTWWHLHPAHTLV